MDAIETKEIRGLSVKALGWLVGSTGTVVVFIVANYFLLKNNIEKVDGKIDAVKTEKGADDRYNDLRMKVLEANVDALKVQVDNLRNQVGTNKNTIEELKQGK